MYPFLLQFRNKILWTVSGKNDDAGMWMPGLDSGDDSLEPGGGKAGVCGNDQIILSVLFVLNIPGGSAVGLQNRCMVTVFPEYLPKTGPNYLFFRNDQYVFDPSPSYAMKACTQTGHRLRRPMDKLSTPDHIIFPAS